MATPWSSSTAYSPGNIVLYNGLEYIRSCFPGTPTTGTPPTDEMSTDTYGTDIRTWTLYYQSYRQSGFFKLSLITTTLALTLVLFWLTTVLKLKVSEDEARVLRTDNCFTIDEELSELKLSVFKFISNKYDEVVEL